MPGSSTGPRRYGRTVPGASCRSPLRFDRRQFLQLAGRRHRRVLLGPRFAGRARRARRRRGYRAGQLPQDFNAFLRIGEDGRVSGFTGKVEYGQGVITSLAQMLAEELDVPSGFRGHGDGRYGSLSVGPWARSVHDEYPHLRSGPPSRRGGSQGRAHRAGGRTSGRSPKERLKTKAGAVYEEAGQKKVSYAELAQGAEDSAPPEGRGSPSPRPTSPWWGETCLQKRRCRQKVTGQAKYAGDVREPGLLHARILRPPAHGAKLLRADTSGARAVEGVQIVEDGDLIAVLHPLSRPGGESPGEYPGAISTGRRPPWMTRRSSTTCSKSQRQGADGGCKGETSPRGEIAARQVLEQTYLNSYVSHAPIETHAALAKIEGGQSQRSGPPRKRPSP
jgi:nicotinate dehydrogenase subunit B